MSLRDTGFQAEPRKWDGLVTLNLESPSLGSLICGSLKSDRPTSAAPGSQNRSPNANAGLIPTLGLFTTTMMVIGGVIGSGIFRKAGVMASSNRLAANCCWASGLSRGDHHTVRRADQRGSRRPYSRNRRAIYLFRAHVRAVLRLPLRLGSFRRHSNRLHRRRGLCLRRVRHAICQTPGIQFLARRFFHSPPGFIGDVAPLPALKSASKGLAGVLVLGLTAVQLCRRQVRRHRAEYFHHRQGDRDGAAFFGRFSAAHRRQLRQSHDPECDHSSHRFCAIRRHGRRDAGRLLGLRRLEHDHLYRGRSEATAAQHPARPRGRNAHRHGHLHAHQRRLRLCPPD